MNPLSKNPKKTEMGMVLYNEFHGVYLQVHDYKFVYAVGTFQVAQLMTRFLCRSSEFKVFSGIIKISCCENNVNTCKACTVFKICGNNHTGWN